MTATKRQYMKRLSPGLAPYAAPEAEIFEINPELGFMVISGYETGNATIDDLEEDDYSGSIIWNN